MFSLEVKGLLWHSTLSLPHYQVFFATHKYIFPYFYFKHRSQLVMTVPKASELLLDGQENTTGTCLNIRKVLAQFLTSVLPRVFRPIGHEFNFLQAAERRKISFPILALAPSHHLPKAPGSEWCWDWSWCPELLPVLFWWAVLPAPPAAGRPGGTTSVLAKVFQWC